MCSQRLAIHDVVRKERVESNYHPGIKIKSLSFVCFGNCISSSLKYNSRRCDFKQDG